jgi:hypothetical protein
MKPIIAAIMAGFLIFAAGCSASPSREKIVGGYESVAVTNQDAVNAAAFAIQAQTQKNPGSKLELVSLQKASQQVVAGMNYKLSLKVKRDGQLKTAEAVVWWQPWRTPDPFWLTAWTWN